MSLPNWKIALPLVAIYTACVQNISGNQAESIVGTWQNTDQSSAEIEILLREDGSYSSKFSTSTGKTETGTWTIDKDSLIRTAKNCYEGTKKISCVNHANAYIALLDQQNLKLQLRLWNPEFRIDTTLSMSYRKISP